MRFDPKVVAEENFPEDASELALPDDLAALGITLESEAAMLAECYPPPALGSTARLVEPSAGTASSRSRQAVIAWAATGLATALAVALGGLGIWRGVSLMEWNAAAHQEVSAPAPPGAGNEEVARRTGEADEAARLAHRREKMDRAGYEAAAAEGASPAGLDERPVLNLHELSEPELEGWCDLWPDIDVSI